MGFIIPVLVFFGLVCDRQVCNPVTHPDVKRISFSQIKNPDNTYSWDYKSQRQFAPFITIIEGIFERTRLKKMQQFEY